MTTNPNSMNTVEMIQNHRRIRACDAGSCHARRKRSITPPP